MPGGLTNSAEGVAHAFVSLRRFLRRNTNADAADGRRRRHRHRHASDAGADRGADGASGRSRPKSSPKKRTTAAGAGVGKAALPLGDEPSALSPTQTVTTGFSSSFSSCSTSSASSASSALSHTQRGPRAGGHDRPRHRPTPPTAGEVPAAVMRPKTFTRLAKLLATQWQEGSAAAAAAAAGADGPGDAVMTCFPTTLYTHHRHAPAAEASESESDDSHRGAAGSPAHQGQRAQSSRRRGGGQLLVTDTAISRWAAALVEELELDMKYYATRSAEAAAAAAAGQGLGLVAGQLQPAEPGSPMFFPPPLAAYQPCLPCPSLGGAVSSPALVTASHFFPFPQRASTAAAAADVVEAAASETSDAGLPQHYRSLSAGAASPLTSFRFGPPLATASSNDFASAAASSSSPLLPTGAGVVPLVPPTADPPPPPPQRAGTISATEHVPHRPRQPVSERRMLLLLRSLVAISHTLAITPLLPSNCCPATTAAGRGEAAIAARMLRRHGYYRTGAGGSAKAAANGWTVPAAPIRILSTASHPGAADTGMDLAHHIFIEQSVLEALLSFSVCCPMSTALLEACRTTLLVVSCHAYGGRHTGAGPQAPAPHPLALWGGSGSLVPALLEFVAPPLLLADVLTPTHLWLAAVAAEALRWADESRVGYAEQSGGDDAETGESAASVCYGDGGVPIDIREQLAVQVLLQASRIAAAASSSSSSSSSGPPTSFLLGSVSPRNRPTHAAGDLTPDAGGSPTAAPRQEPEGAGGPSSPSLSRHSRSFSASLSAAVAAVTGASRGPSHVEATVPPSPLAAPGALPPASGPSATGMHFLLLPPHPDEGHPPTMMPRGTASAAQNIGEAPPPTPPSSCTAADPFAATALLQYVALLNGLCRGLPASGKRNVFDVAASGDGERDHGAAQRRRERAVSVWLAAAVQLQHVRSELRVDPYAASAIASGVDLTAFLAFSQQQSPHSAWCKTCPSTCHATPSLSAPTPQDLRTSAAADADTEDAASPVAPPAASITQRLRRKMFPQMATPDIRGDGAAGSTSGAASLPLPATQRTASGPTAPSSAGALPSSPTPSSASRGGQAAPLVAPRRRWLVLPLLDAASLRWELTEMWLEWCAAPSQRSPALEAVRHTWLDQPQVPPPLWFLLQAPRGGGHSPAGTPVRSNGCFQPSHTGHSSSTCSGTPDIIPQPNSSSSSASSRSGSPSSSRRGTPPRPCSSQSLTLFAFLRLLRLVSREAAYRQRPSRKTDAAAADGGAPAWLRRVGRIAMCPAPWSAGPTEATLWPEEEAGSREESAPALSSPALRSQWWSASGRLVRCVLPPRPHANDTEASLVHAAMQALLRLPITHTPATESLYRQLLAGLMALSHVSPLNAQYLTASGAVHALIARLTWRAAETPASIDAAAQRERGAGDAPAPRCRTRKDRHHRRRHHHHRSSSSLAAGEREGEPRPTRAASSSAGLAQAPCFFAPFAPGSGMPPCLRRLALLLTSSPIPADEGDTPEQLEQLCGGWCGTWGAAAPSGLPSGNCREELRERVKETRRLLRTAWGPTLRRDTLDTIGAITSSFFDAATLLPLLSATMAQLRDVPGDSAAGSSVDTAVLHALLHSLRGSHPRYHLYRPRQGRYAELWRRWRLGEERRKTATEPHARRASGPRPSDSPTPNPTPTSTSTSTSTSFEADRLSVSTDSRRHRHRRRSMRDVAEWSGSAGTPPPVASRSPSNSTRSSSSSATRSSSAGPHRRHHRTRRARRRHHVSAALLPDPPAPPPPLNALFYLPHAGRRGVAAPLRPLPHPWEGYTVATWIYALSVPAAEGALLFALHSDAEDEAILRLYAVSDASGGLFFRLVQLCRAASLTEAVALAASANAAAAVNAGDGADLPLDHPTHPSHLKRTARAITTYQRIFQHSADGRATCRATPVYWWEQTTHISPAVLLNAPSGSSSPSTPVMTPPPPATTPSHRQDVAVGATDAYFQTVFRGVADTDATTPVGGVLPSGGTSADAATLPAAQSWVHVAYTHSVSHWALYVQGVLAVTLHDVWYPSGTASSHLPLSASAAASTSDAGSDDVSTAGSGCVIGFGGEGPLWAAWERLKQQQAGQGMASCRLPASLRACLPPAAAASNFSTPPLLVSEAHSYHGYFTGLAVLHGVLDASSIHRLALAGAALPCREGLRELLLGAAYHTIHSTDTAAPLPSAAASPLLTAAQGVCEAVRRGKGVGNRSGRGRRQSSRQPGQEEGEGELRHLPPRTEEDMGDGALVNDAVDQAMEDLFLLDVRCHAPYRGLGVVNTSHCGSRAAAAAGLQRVPLLPLLHAAAEERQLVQEALQTLMACRETREPATPQAGVGHSSEVPGGAVSAAPARGGRPLRSLTARRLCLPLISTILWLAEGEEQDSAVHLDDAPSGEGAPGRACCPTGDLTRRAARSRGDHRAALWSLVMPPAAVKALEAEVLSWQVWGDTDAALLLSLATTRGTAAAAHATCGSGGAGAAVDRAAPCRPSSSSGASLLRPHASTTAVLSALLERLRASVCAPPAPTGCPGPGPAAWNDAGGSLRSANADASATPLSGTAAFGRFFMPGRSAGVAARPTAQLQGDRRGAACPCAIAPQTLALILQELSICLVQPHNAELFLAVPHSYTRLLQVGVFAPPRLSAPVVEVLEKLCKGSVEVRQTYQFLLDPLLPDRRDIPYRDGPLELEPSLPLATEDVPEKSGGRSTRNAERAWRCGRRAVDQFKASVLCMLYEVSRADEGMIARLAHGGDAIQVAPDALPGELEGAAEVVSPLVSGEPTAAALSTLKPTLLFQQEGHRPAIGAGLWELSVSPAGAAGRDAMPTVTGAASHHQHRGLSYLLALVCGRGIHASERLRLYALRMLALLLSSNKKMRSRFVKQQQGYALWVKALRPAGDRPAEETGVPLEDDDDDDDDDDDVWQVPLTLPTLDCLFHVAFDAYTPTPLGSFSPTAASTTATGTPGGAAAAVGAVTVEKAAGSAAAEGHDGGPLAYAPLPHTFEGYFPCRIPLPQLPAVESCKGGAAVREGEDPDSPGRRSSASSSSLDDSDSATSSSSGEGLAQGRGEAPAASRPAPARRKEELPTHHHDRLKPQQQQQQQQQEAATPAVAPGAEDDGAGGVKQKRVIAVPPAMELVLAAFGVLTQRIAAQYARGRRLRLVAKERMDAVQRERSGATAEPGVQSGNGGESNTAETCTSQQRAPGTRKDRNRRAVAAQAQQQALTAARAAESSADQLLESVLVPGLHYLEKVLDYTPNGTALLPYPWLEWLHSAFGPAMAYRRQLRRLVQVQKDAQKFQHRRVDSGVSGTSLSTSAGSGAGAAGSSSASASGAKPLWYYAHYPEALTLRVTLLFRHVVRKLTVLDMSTNARATTILRLKALPQPPEVLETVLEEVCRHFFLRGGEGAVEMKQSMSKAQRMIRNLDVLCRDVLPVMGDRRTNGNGTAAATAPLLSLSLGADVVCAINAIAVNNVSTLRRFMKNETELFRLRDGIAHHLLTHIPQLHLEDHRLLGKLLDVCANDWGVTVVLLRRFAEAMSARDTAELESVVHLLRQALLSTEGRRTVMDCLGPEGLPLGLLMCDADGADPEEGPHDTEPLVIPLRGGAPASVVSGAAARYSRHHLRGEAYSDPYSSLHERHSSLYAHTPQPAGVSRLSSAVLRPASLYYGDDDLASHGCASSVASDRYSRGAVDPAHAASAANRMCHGRSDGGGDPTATGSGGGGHLSANSVRLTSQAIDWCRQHTAVWAVIANRIYQRATKEEQEYAAYLSQTPGTARGNRSPAPGTPSVSTAGGETAAGQASEWAQLLQRARDKHLHHRRETARVVAREWENVIRDTTELLSAQPS